MWALDNRTPYGAARNWVRDKQGRHLWVVAVKATFDVTAGGQLELADEQPAPALEPTYWGEPGQSSLRSDSDLLYVKPCTDVIAEAEAWAVGGPASVVPVSMRVGPIQKQLLVYGDRVYYKGAVGLTTTRPSAFSSRPIVYEWAFGGFDRSDPDPARHRLDERNPVGRGFAVDEDVWVHQSAHAIEYPHGAVKRVGPAGFGPIDPAWVPRRRYAGTYDATWARKKKPLLPDDYDERFGSSAPEDQRVSPHLRGGERVELQGLTAQSLLRFELPKVGLTYTTHVGSRREEHRGRLVTVHLRPSAMQLALVWQTALFVKPEDTDYLDKTQIGEKRYL